jgi:hypothetical protein
MLGVPNASNSTTATSPTAVQGTVNSFTTQTGTVQASTGSNGYVLKFVSSGNIVIGANNVCHDFTGRKSSVALGACEGQEVDIVASGPDDNSSRAGQVITFAESGPSEDGSTTIAYGSLLRPQAANSQTSPNPAKALAGYAASTMLAVPGSSVGNGVYGSFRDAFFCDGGETGCYDITSATENFSLSAMASSGQANLDFPLGTNINVGQSVSGSANLPAGATVSAVYQCWTTQPLSGCGGKTNETLVTLSGNLTGNITSATFLAFTGVLTDGSLFSGIFSDAFANWTNQGAAGVIKAGTTKNSGTALTITALGEDSSNTPNIDYGDINFKINTNTHGATVGELNFAPSGSGCVTIGAPTGGCEGANTTNIHGTLYIDGVAAGTGTITNGDLSGDCSTSGTLVLTCSGLAPKASPTFAGTVALPDGSTVGAAWTIATAMAMGGHGFTAAGAYIGQATNGPEVFGSSTASSTVPTFAPNRASANTGVGAQASGNLSLIASGVEIERVTASGIVLESGAYFSGATSGVTCSGAPTSSFAATNGIVTHC